MSYCRFSSMNWRCDVYVYQDTYGGFVTHVAGCRRVIPPIPDIMGGRVAMWLYRWCGCAWDKAGKRPVFPHFWRGMAYKAWTRFSIYWHRYVHGLSMKMIPLRNIDLPHDTESFNDATPGECADRLEYLRGLGYKVPQDAIDALREEEKP